MPLRVTRASTLVAVTIGLAAGILVGVLLGRTVDIANWVTAAATVALTGFALVQLLRIEADADDLRNQRRHRLESLATLARRSCEAAVAEEAYYGHITEWAAAISARLDPVEAQVLEIRTLAASLGEEIEAATNAFAAFMAAAGRVNVLGDPRTAMTRAQMDELRKDALDFFQHTAIALDRISPAVDDYPALPRGYARMMKDYPPL